MDWLNVKGKTVIITGGSSGIGLAIVRELCTLGMNVVNADLQLGNYQAPNLFFSQTDVTDAGSVNQTVEKTI